VGTHLLLGNHLFNEAIPSDSLGLQDIWVLGAVVSVEGDLVLLLNDFLFLGVLDSEG
jgi:hypothetical protein